MMFWYGGGWAWWQMGLMWAGMIAFWGLLIWALYAVITNLTRKPSQQYPGGEARRTLDERLARGEIDPEDYQRLRGLIDSDRPPAAAGDRDAR